MNKYTKKYQILAKFILILLLLLGFNASARVEYINLNEDIEKEDEILNNLNLQIEDRKKEASNLKFMDNHYKKKIDELRNEETSLKNQLLLLDNQVKKKENDIKITENDISRATLEVKKINNNIESLEKELFIGKKDLEGLIKNIYEERQISYISVLILEKSFSSFYNKISHLENIQDSLKVKADNLIKSKEKLAQAKVQEENNKKELNSLKIDLENQRAQMQGQLEAKERILAETNEKESEFNDLLLQIKKEQQAANSEIQSLELKIRQLLEAKQLEGLDMLASPGLIYPVASHNGVSAHFHDPDYPYRHLFEHPGIDLRVAQGTPVRASETGYVAIAKDAGMGYSYVLIVHADGISTVYGHLSRIDVKQDTYVVKGQTIGLSGGMPGTPGAGRLTTGPHLHFEVRLNGIPVNPLNYLN